LIKFLLSTVEVLLFNTLVWGLTQNLVLGN